MRGAALRQQAPLAAIKLARRAFANTPVQRLPIVSWMYRRTVALAWGTADVVAGFRGTRLTIPGSDAWYPAAIVGGFYEAIELDLLERLAACSRTVLDVGANIGIYACVAGTRLPDEGRLIAFEPAPRNLEYLRRNLDDNGLSDRVRVEPVAVGESAGETLLYLDADCGGNNSLAAGMVPNSTDAVPVAVTSLDAFLASADLPSPVDLVKIDVEGYDGYVLRGAAGLLRDQRPTLLVEFVAGHLVRAGFSPAEFLDLVFGTYSHVFVINEPRGRFEPCGRDELAGLADRAARLNLNLVAVDRPEHLRLIREYRQASEGR